MLLVRITAIISLLLYFLAPREYSLMFSLVCFGNFAISSFAILKNNCKYTIIKFELFFIIAYFFSNIIYSTYYFINNPFFGLFYLDFNQDYINKGLALSVVGICFFNLGNFEKYPHCYRKENIPNLILKSPKPLLIPLFLLFLPELYATYSLEVYSTAHETSAINTILMYVLYCSLFIEVYNSKKNNTLYSFVLRNGNLVWVLTIIYIALLLMIGSRTIPLRVILFVFFLYSVFINKPSNKIVLLFFLFGAVVMTAIGIIREGYSFDISAASSVLDFGKDLTINNRSLYVLMEYADKNGYTFGRTMILSVLCIVPYAMSSFLAITGLKVGDVNSANLVTDLYYNSVSNVDNHIGLGTNIIGDIYVSFGLLGVIICMYFMGMYLRILYSKICNGNIVAILIYATIFLDVIYWPRSVFLTPLRTVAWTYLFFYLYNKKMAK